MKNLVFISLLALVTVNAFAREGHESNFFFNRSQEIAATQQQEVVAAPTIDESSKTSKDTASDSPCIKPCCS